MTHHHALAAIAAKVLSTGCCCCYVCFVGMVRYIVGQGVLYVNRICNMAPKFLEKFRRKCSKITVLSTKGSHKPIKKLRLP